MATDLFQYMTGMHCVVYVPYYKVNMFCVTSTHGELATYCVILSPSTQAFIPQRHLCNCNISYWLLLINILP